MKRVKLFITIIAILFICSYNVNAKDTLYSINKYKEENFDFIMSSYNKKGNIDGQVVAGNFLENPKTETELEKNENYQIIVIKYNNEGKKIWDFSYGKNSPDTIDYLTYTYDTEGEIDGYLIAMKASNEITESPDTTPSVTDKGIFLKIDLSGKVVWEKETMIPNYIRINKLIPTYNDNQMFDGYIAIATYQNSTSKSNANLIRYDKECNIIWSKKQEASSSKEIYYSDLINIYENNNVIGYAVIENEKDDETTTSKLLKFSKTGEPQVLIESLGKYETYNLEESNDGYLIFGLTKEVKLKNGNYSYYLINYDSKNNELWETFGDIPLSEKGPLKLLSTKKTNKTEYLLLYQNATDSSMEVAKFDTLGVFESKIKKINNDYYKINNFQAHRDVLYFIGHLSCPEDDICNYNTNSLFLVSTEDKVIEVKENDSKRILLVSITIIILIAIIIIFKKKRKLN